MRRAKGVYGRMKVKGWKRRLNWKKETKMTTQITQGGGIINFATGIALNVDSPTVLWSSNTVGPDGNTLYINWPQAGAGENQVEGTKWNSMYCEVNFDLFQDPTVTPSTTFNTLRVVMLRKRDPSIVFSYTNLLLRNTRNSLAPIDSKKYDIFFDKLYQFTTGRSFSNQVAVNNQIVGYTSLGPKSKRFRIIIPFRKTWVIQPQAAGNHPETIFVVAWTSNADNLSWVQSNVVTALYFKDP